MRKKIEKIETLDDFASFLAVFALDEAKTFVEELLERHELPLQSWVEVIIFTLFAADVVSCEHIHKKLPGKRGFFWNSLIHDVRDFSRLEEVALRYFDDIIDCRFQEYFQALQLEHELGPMWNIGKVATKNIIGEKEKDCLSEIMLISLRFGMNVKLFENYFLEPELFIW